MSECLHFEDLHSSDAVRVSACRCRPHSTALAGEERSSDHSIVFVRRGAFVKHVAGEQFTLDVNCVVFFRRDETYRVSHLDTAGDDCTILRVSDADLLDAARAYDARANDDPARPVRFTHGPCEPGTDLLHRRFLHALRRSSHDENAVAEVVFDLVDAALSDSAQAWNVRRRPTIRPRTRQADRDRVEAAKAALIRQFREKVTLGEVARAVDCSAYHLSRVFKRETGQTGQSYLSRLRLRAAIDAILEGRGDLTHVALEAGFYDHSHFTNAFSRAFGFPPSALRGDPSRTALNEIRAVRRSLNN